MSGLTNSKKELYETFNQEEYMKIWFQLVEEMEREGFSWPSLLENDEWNQYMSPSLYEMPREVWQNIQTATYKVTQVLQKTVDLLKENPQFLHKLSIPYKLWDAIFSEQENSLFSYFTRYDFIVNGNDIKLIEANVDTPTGLLEPSVANRIICKAHGAYHPNMIEENLTKAWNLIKADYNIQDSDKIFFTSFGWHDEDKKTTLFNMKHCEHPLKEYVDVGEIIVADDGIYSPQGEPIKFLYRLYPLEFLLEDVDDQGKHIGELFLEHIAEGRVKVINPPNAMIIQTKSILALIWELYENNYDGYNEEEKEIIRKYFLPTYLSADKFIATNTPYVSKPIYGREGGGVSIIENNMISEEDRTDYYYKQPKIYQQYMEMPNQSIGTWDGDYHGKLLIGSHLIGGNPSGVFLRVGEKITGNLSMFMGLTVK